MKIALALLTKDRCELTRQSMKPLFAGAGDDKFDLFWFDGSETEAGKRQPSSCTEIYSNVTGGAGVALVTALATMLDHPNEYTHIGLVENDTLLLDGWQECFDLFKTPNLRVGAVSARCYEDRILIQRDGYAVCHNLGAGHVVFTRAAARLVLKTFRSAWTTDNRRIFSHLSGIDIGRYWAFGSNPQFLTADWHWDAMLAAHGYASLALTPSPVEMIGQEPPLAEQGLTIAKAPVEKLRDNWVFEFYRDRLNAVAEGQIGINIETQFFHDAENGTWTVFPNQIRMLGGSYKGQWSVRDYRLIGPLTWQAEEAGASFEVPLGGACTLLVSGGPQGGTVIVEDKRSNYKATPLIPPGTDNMLALPIPGSFVSRTVKVTMQGAGMRFIGIQMREAPFRVPVPLTVEGLLT